MLRRPLLRRLAYARRNRCSVLLAALIMFILVSPLLAGSAVGAMALAAGMVAILVLSVWALRVRRLAMWALSVLAFVTVDVLVVDRMGAVWIRPVGHVAVAAFLGTVTVALLRYVLDRRAITTDKVFGAVAAYVLVAFSFASLFGLLQVFEPDAFHAVVPGPDGRLAWPDLMYFSFTVLTSTGFGEITPGSHMARNLVVIEQILGVMYVAFLIARLANMYGSRRQVQ